MSDSLASRRFPPMKAVSGPLPVGEGWAYEPKWDGMRLIAVAEHGELHLRTGNGIDATDRFPELAELAAVLPHPTVLDGEAVVLDGARPSFERLQGRIHVSDRNEALRRAVDAPVTLVVFDLLHLDGHDTMPLGWQQRRGLLDELVEAGPSWVVSAVTDDGPALFEATRASGMEGVIAKRVGSPYEPGRRSHAWRKTKVRRSQEVVVGGWAEGEGNRSGRIGGLLVGHYDGGALRFAGRVGSGLDERELARLGDVLAQLSSDICPFEPPPPRAMARGARWVRPEVVVDVEFAEWTAEGRMRHPTYRGQRVDKEPTEVVREPD